jgi:hypothetical protein
MQCLVDDDPSLGQVDPSRIQGHPDQGEPVHEIRGKPKLIFGGATGPGECSPNLGCSRILDLVQPIGRTQLFLAGFGHRHHVGIQFGLIVGHQPVMRLHQDHPVKPRQPLPVHRRYIEHTFDAITYPRQIPDSIP